MDGVNTGLLSPVGFAPALGGDLREFHILVCDLFPYTEYPPEGSPSSRYFWSN